MARKDRKQRDEQDAAGPDAGASAAAEAPPEPAQSGQPGRITATDIQQKEFRVAFRGYNERDVDVFLDQVTEEIARLHADNKRLREEVELRGGTGLVGADEADAIIRQARLEADRILADARANAAVPGAGPRDGSLTPEEAATARVLIGAFLAREREFLQTVANLIQDHAQSVKDSAARAREEIASVTPAPAPPMAVPATGRGPAGPAAATAQPTGSPAPAAPSTPAVATPAPARAATPPPPEPGPEAGSAPPPPPPPRVAEAPSAVRAPVGEPTPAPIRPPSTLLDAAPETTRSARSADPTVSPAPIRRDPVPPRAPEHVSPQPPGADPEDRSIQELFWGEV